MKPKFKLFIVSIFIGFIIVFAFMQIIGVDASGNNRSYLPIIIWTVPISVPNWNVLTPTWSPCWMLPTDIPFSCPLPTPLSGTPVPSPIPTPNE